MSKGQSILKLSNIVNISVCAVIKKGDKYLLIREKERGDKVAWNFPSGKSNYGEHLLEAVKRETLEETGLNVVVTDLISVYYYHSKNNSHRRDMDRTTVRFNFWADIGSGATEPKPQDKDIVEAVWKSADEIRELVEQGKMRNWIARSVSEDVLKGKRIPLDNLLIKRK